MIDYQDTVKQYGRVFYGEITTPNKLVIKDNMDPFY